MCPPEASAEGSPCGRRPEGSEGCTACARQDGARDFFETAPGDFEAALNTKLKSTILGLFFRIEKVRPGEKRCQKITTKS